MRPYTTIHFERLDRNVFDRANVHLSLAFPNAGKEHSRGTAEPDSLDDKARLVLRLGINGTPATLAKLREAQAIYGVLLAKAEADLAVWRRERDRIQAELVGGPVPQGSIGVAFVADPMQLCNVLIEAREATGRDVSAVLQLLEEAVALVPAAERDSHDSDL